MFFNVYISFISYRMLLISIGTGGSAIYALLGAKLNNWLMVGTDIHKESLAYAQKNVGLNSLENNIKSNSSALLI